MSITKDAHFVLGGLLSVLNEQLLSVSMSLFCIL